MDLRYIIFFILRVYMKLVPCIGILKQQMFYFMMGSAKLQILDSRNKWSQIQLLQLFWELL